MKIIFSTMDKLKKAFEAAGYKIGVCQYMVDGGKIQIWDHNATIDVFVRPTREGNDNNN